MHSTFTIRRIKLRPALAGFPLFLAKVGGLALLWLTLWAALAASTALEKPRFPVVGQIVCDGRPAAGARVRLFPRSGQPQSARAAAWGTTASDGTFQVKTLGWADGAAAGKYAVTVSYEPPVISGEGFSIGPQLLSDELTDPHTTPLAIEVRPAANELGLLSLETPRAALPITNSPRWLLSQSRLSQGER